MKAAKVIHVVYRETLNQVLESQVLRPAARLAGEVDIEVVALTPLGLLIRSPWRQKVAALRHHAESDLGIGFHAPIGLPARFQKSAVDDVALVRALRKAIDPARPNLLHCRGAHATRCALTAARGRAGVRVIFDCRGDDPAEAVARLGFDADRRSSWNAAAESAWSKALENEAAAVAGADSIVCVSEALKAVLADRHGIDASKISVLPCAVDCDLFSPRYRKAARRDLGVEGKFVVGYVGSVTWYQCLDESLALFEAVRECHPQAHFLGITSDPDPLCRRLAERGISPSSFTLRSVASSEVCRLVPAMDLGLLLRRDHAVNRVASPVKFGEYLASGVPVLLTPSIGDFSRLTATEKLGAVIAFPEDAGRVDTGGLTPALADEAARRRCRAFAERHLSTRALAEHFRRLYGCGSKANPTPADVSMVPVA